MNKSSMLKNYIDRFYDQYKKSFDNKDEKEAVKIAVDLAYKDAQRTMKGIDQKKRNEAKSQIVEEVCKYLENSSNNDFDSKHAELCGIWCKKFEGIDHGSYGKAQKIVNMTFKYMYCYYHKNKYSKDKMKLFKDCHFTIDSLTLRWLNGCTTNKEKKPRWLKGDIKWSSFFAPEKEAKDNYKCEEYNQLQKYAKECVADLFGKDITVLEAEFFIWDNVNYYDFLKNMSKQKDLLVEDNLIINEKLEEMDVCCKHGLNGFIEDRVDNLYKS